MRTRSRSAFTVAEALVSVVLLAVVAGLVAASLAARQQGAREAAELRAVRADLRDAAAILAHELRGSAVAGDTLRLTADTALEFFMPVFTGVVCAAGEGRVHLAPLRPRGGGAVTSMVVAPDTGDLAWLWTQDSLDASGRWQRRRVLGFSEAAPAACAAELVPGAVQPAPVLTLAGDLATILPGAPVHVVRRGRYSVYRASDGRWYLGYRRCNALGPSSCGTIQPVAGPYRARAGGEAGVRFRYFDAANGELSGGAAATAAVRVEIVIRSDTAHSARRVRRERALDDSLHVVVALRNAR